MAQQLTPEAQRTIRKHQAEAPVDVSALADALGIRVWESGMLPIGISGVLKRDPENGGHAGYSIIVNSDDALTRKRFTVAHEIAHFLLHREAIGASLSDDTFYRSGLTGSQEIEANALAAEILMPEHLLAPEQNEPVGATAQKFQVSQLAMAIRLRKRQPTL